LCYNVYMPRYVDETARRRLIAEATMRLVAADGLQAASVRRIADEAGLSMGSLRHYFRSQDELIVYTMRLIRDRVRDRIQKLDLPPDDPVAAATTLLSELIPLDRDRMAEFEVWLALSGRSLVNPALAEVREQSDTDIRRLCERVVRWFCGDAEDERIRLETERLYALVDGLALHRAMQPDATTTEAVVATLRRHLEALRGD